MVTVGQPHRGTGKQDKFRFACQSMTFTWSWGAQPASGTAVYVSRANYPPIMVGAALELDCYGKKFYGVVKSGPTLQMNEDGTIESIATNRSSTGQHLSLDFVDTRDYLACDQVFCAYNLLDKRIVNGQRVRRYRHMRPWDWPFWAWSYTLYPLSAATIIREIMSFNVRNPAYSRVATIGTYWTGQFHADMERYPVLNIDALNGRQLDEVLVEISEKLALMFTLMNGPFNLVWARRGEGVLPSFPVKSDDQEARTVLTGAPQRVFVVGDRNLYLVLNLAMRPDWNRNWEELLTVDGLAYDLFEHASDPVTGTAYKSTNPNPILREIEDMSGMQLASARAREITVNEYATLRNSQGRDGTYGGGFWDRRLFQGRSRGDIAAAMYVEELLFRAFRPPNFVNIGGTQVPVEALRMTDDMPARVEHNIATGAMSVSLENVIGGNGYVIGLGFNADRVLLSQIPLDRFDVDKFQQTLSVWTSSSFQTDDSGEDGGFIILDEPFVPPDDIILTEKLPGMEWLNGYAVINAWPTFRAPNIRAALVFEGDRFRYPVMLPGAVIDPNNATRDATIGEAGLRQERVVDGATGQILDVQVGALTYREIPYADGVTANQKAIDAAIPILSTPYAYQQGSYTWIMRDGETPPDLTSMLSRVTLENSESGHVCRIEMTAERAVRTYTPERDYDRARRLQQVLQRQQELLDQAREWRQLAGVLRQTPEMSRELNTVFKTAMGIEQGGVSGQIKIQNGSGSLQAGTPIRKLPNARTSYTPTSGVAQNRIYNTEGVLPSAATEDHQELAGVTVRHNENAGRNIRVQTTGIALVRVKGPANFGDNLQLPTGEDVTGDYLVRQEGAGLTVGRLLDQTVPEGATRLAKVQLGGGGGGGSSRDFVWL